MARNPKIKLKMKTDKQLNELISCSVCGGIDMYRSMFFIVDESNIRITENYSFINPSSV